MRDITYFTHPQHDWQKRYKAMRASFVDRLPGGKAARRRVTYETRQKIRRWREQLLSAGEITELLSEDSIEISVRTVERVLVEEGFSKLPRRTRQKTGFTVKGAEIPARSELVLPGRLEGQKFTCATAGVFLFSPFLAQLNLDKIVKDAGLPGSKVIPAKNYLLSFLALKLLGTERHSHAGDHVFDPGLGLFAGLNVIPKCTALFTYSHSLDEAHLLSLQHSFVQQATNLGLYKEKIINLDFHTAPGYGDESVLEKHWAGARGKVLKGALCLFVQDADSKLMVYTAADIQRSEADDQVMSFLSFWQGIRRGVQPTLIFDSRFTNYTKLSELNSKEIKIFSLYVLQKIQKNC
jgi:hypothetical protein